MDQSLIHKVGYAEMYEVVNPNKTMDGRFVQFDDVEVDKITLCRNVDKLVGVVSINYVSLSDNPDQWPKKYLSNDFGDVYVQNKHLARGKKEMDESEQFEYIKTYESFETVPFKHPDYIEGEPYIPRINRPEWKSVNLLGKCIVYDCGTCKPGEFCTIYNGNEEYLFGSAMPASPDDKIKFYVLSRYTENTCVILYK